MGYVEELIMNINFLKYEKWHYFSQITKGFKNNLLGREIDCYNYNIQQFSESRDKVLGYLSKPFETVSSSEANQIKLEIKANQKNIQKKVNEIHDNMFVKNPFIPENAKKMRVQSELLFDSYLKQIVYSTAQLEDALDLKFHETYGGIRRFSEYVHDCSLKCQSLASSILKEYNSNYQNQDCCITK